MNKNIKSALTKGLLSGYAGGKPQDVTRGGFSGKVSHIKLPDGNVYHDEWFANSSGGGQELVQVGNETFTRLYGGGTPNKEILSSLGISDSEIGSYLRNKIGELGEKTRLIEDCEPEQDGDWQYRYQITGNYSTTHLITALESIAYKNIVVHHHAFILCPIK